MFEQCIFVSSEDDKYLVHGGIGTYLGILTKWIRLLFPQTQVFWVAKSPTHEDIYEEDAYGVQRIYLSDFQKDDELAFLNRHSILVNNRLAKYTSFLQRVEESILSILLRFSDKKTLIEVGEWEGQANGLFRSIRNHPSIFKVVRLHTPLAVCMEQNQLLESEFNFVQMLNEYQQIKHADYISSCTQYMKEKVIAKVLGAGHALSHCIDVFPNPIDTESFMGTSCSRKQSLQFLNQLRPGIVTDATFNVFMLGSVESRKGVEYVVRAIEDTAKMIPDVRFCFFGHHADENFGGGTANTKLHPKALYQMIPAHLHCHLAFFNYIPHSQLPFVIACGDVFPILSLGDNFPGTVAEIALMAKPIVALERGGVKEMLQDEHGAFQALSIGSDLNTAPALLACSLVEIYNQPKKGIEIGRKLQQLMLSKYDPQVVVPTLLQTYWTAFKNQMAPLESLLSND